MTDTTSNEALQCALKKVDTENTRALLNDVDAYNYSLAMLNGTLKMASGSKTDIIFGLIDKTTSTTDIIAKSSNAKNIKLTSSAAQILIQSASLISLAGKTNPGVVLATVGAATTKKFALALGLAENNKQAKCMAAYADLASNLLGTGVATAAAIGSGGLTGILAIGAFSQLVLSSYETYNTCHK